MAFKLPLEGAISLKIHALFLSHLFMKLGVPLLKVLVMRAPYL